VLLSTLERDALDGRLEIHVVLDDADTKLTAVERPPTARRRWRAVQSHEALAARNARIHAGAGTCCGCRRTPATRPERSSRARRARRSLRGGSGGSGPGEGGGMEGARTPKKSAAEPSGVKLIILIVPLGRHAYELVGHCPMSRREHRAELEARDERLLALRRQRDEQSDGQRVARQALARPRGGPTRRLRARQARPGPARRQCGSRFMRSPRTRG
jgi:hypothetical protein